MSLLSKLIGAAVDKKLEQTVKSAVNGAVSSALNAATKIPTQQSRPVSAPSSVQRAAQPAEEASGFSWGPTMPEEENQYNYPGSYVDYFAHVFREDFPEYRVTHEEAAKRRATVFTFWTPSGSRALVVELMTENSEAKKFRKECAAQGLPYLRFYYDHEGWWNTRAYVTERVRAALR